MHKFRWEPEIWQPRPQGLLRFQDLESGVDPGNEVGYMVQHCAKYKLRAMSHPVHSLKRLRATVAFYFYNNNNNYATLRAEIQCRFWQIFVEALEEFPNLFIQSETSASTREYSETNRASKYVTLLGNFVDEHRGLSPVSEAGFRHQLPRLNFVSIICEIARKYQHSLLLVNFYLSKEKLLQRFSATTSRHFKNKINVVKTLRQSLNELKLVSQCHCWEGVSNGLNIGSLQMLRECWDKCWDRFIGALGSKPYAHHP